MNRFFPNLVEIKVKLPWIIYEQLEGSETAIWSLLLASGYLVLDRICYNKGVRWNEIIYDIISFVIRR